METHRIVVVLVQMEWNGVRDQTVVLFFYEKLTYNSDVLVL